MYLHCLSLHESSLSCIFATAPLARRFSIFLLFSCNSGQSIKQGKVSLEQTGLQESKQAKHRSICLCVCLYFFIISTMASTLTAVRRAALVAVVVVAAMSSAVMAQAPAPTPQSSPAPGSLVPSILAPVAVSLLAFVAGAVML